MDEFDLIDRYFKPLGGPAVAAALGIGDDAAVLDVDAGEQIVVTTDTQVESVHFPPNADPARVAYRSCAAALSDIAAMGATARWVSLALTLPRDEPAWLEAFSSGTAAVLEHASASLVGGDTTAGPLCITWNVIGTVPRGQALRRNGGSSGDGLFVSGTLGAAAAALALLDDYPRRREPVVSAVVDRYWAPQARLVLGIVLRGIASSCIDVSDGLVADAGHLAHASNCGVRIERDTLPLLPELVELVGRERALDHALAGGDDYELCFTVPSEYEPLLATATSKSGVDVTRIGRLTDGRGVRIVDRDGNPCALAARGYRHFE